MKSFNRLVILVLVTTFLIIGAGRANSDSGFPRTVIDGAGNKVIIAAKPQHIVSVTLGTDEILLSLVDPARIAAITANALDPDQSPIAEQAAQFKDLLVTADPEKIISLHPDLVFVASYTDAGVVKQLRDSGLTVFLLGNFSNIKDVEGNITLLGEVVGEEAKATEIVAEMEAKLTAVANAVKQAKPVSVLYYGPDGYSDGAGTSVDDVITHAGGINAVVVGGIKEKFPLLNDEWVVKQDPDVVLLAGFNSYAPGFVEKFKTNPNFQTLKAIKNNRVYVANDAHLASVSQYIANGVSDVAALLYPDLYQPTPVATIAAMTYATEIATVTP